MKIYESFDQIDNELKRLKLERDIAWEEIKYSKHKIQENFKFQNIINTLFDKVKSVGVLFLLKKLLKK
jgi:coenzyme F420-reducing hydrogenase delta subunit